MHGRHEEYVTCELTLSSGRWKQASFMRINKNGLWLEITAQCMCFPSFLASAPGTEWVPAAKHLDFLAPSPSLVWWWLLLFLHINGLKLMEYLVSFEMVVVGILWDRRWDSEIVHVIATSDLGFFCQGWDMSLSAQDLGRPTIERWILWSNCPGLGGPGYTFFWQILAAKQAGL